MAANNINYYDVCDPVPIFQFLQRNQLSFQSHLTPHILDLLVSSNKIICRSSRPSLRPTGHKITAPLDLIFSDVWGPTPMFSSDGFHYYVIFVDAHTKHIWYYPLVAKSGVFSTFQRF